MQLTKNKMVQKGLNSNVKKNIFGDLKIERNVVKMALKGLNSNITSRNNNRILHKSEIKCHCLFHKIRFSFKQLSIYLLAHLDMKRGTFQHHNFLIRSKI